MFRLFKIYSKFFRYSTHLITHKILRYISLIQKMRLRATKFFFLVYLTLASVYSLKLMNHIEAHLQIDNYRKLQLAKHNEYRAKHGVGKLFLDQSINGVAQAYAQKLLANHEFKHSGNKNYGENLYWAWGYPKLQYKAGDATISWYNEINDYDFATGKSKNGKVVGHFTAMIWKSATKVGFGIAIGNQDDGKAIYVVANYSPVTNINGKFVANVPRPL